MTEVARQPATQDERFFLSPSDLAATLAQLTLSSALALEARDIGVKLDVRLAKEGDSADDPSGRYQKAELSVGPDQTDSFIFDHVAGAGVLAKRIQGDTSTVTQVVNRHGLRLVQSGHSDAGVQRSRTSRPATPRSILMLARGTTESAPRQEKQLPLEKHKQNVSGDYSKPEVILPDSWVVPLLALTTQVAFRTVLGSVQGRIDTQTTLYAANDRLRSLPLNREVNEVRITSRDRHSTRLAEFILTARSIPRGYSEVTATLDVEQITHAGLIRVRHGVTKVGLQLWRVFRPELVDPGFGPPKPLEVGRCPTSLRSILFMAVLAAKVANSEDSADLPQLAMINV